MTGCSYTLTQRAGIWAEYQTYELRIASHTIEVPRRHIAAGNLFIDLPHRQYTRTIKIPRCSSLPRGSHQVCR